MSPAGYSALRDATPWGHDVFNPFDVEDPGLVLSGLKVVTGVGSVVAPGRRVFPNTLPAKGSRRRHACGLQKRNATPLRLVWKTLFLTWSHP
jgi:hypothetical protein